MIIDVHAHVFPDELAARAVEVLAKRSNVAPHTDGTCAGLLASMRRAGVDRSIVTPIATRPSQVSSINRWAVGISAAKKVSTSDERITCSNQDSFLIDASGQPPLGARGDGITSFGTLHPMQENLPDEIDFLVKSGIRGVKLHPDYQEFFVDEPELTPMYRAIADAGLVLLLHAGVDIGLPPPVHCTPSRLARVLDAVPELTIIAAHMGGYASWDDVERYLLGRKLYFDTSFSLTDLGAERMAAMIRSHGVDRVLFGADSPWTDQAVEIAGLLDLPLADDEKSAVLGGNAERLIFGG